MACNPAIRDWAAQRVWIVGASSGIGAALARELIARGARVAVSARGAAGLAAVRGALALPLDVRDAQALEAAAARLRAQFGGLDLVVYCAGTYAPQRATRFDLDAALAHDEINYRGALRFLNAVLPLLLEQGSGHLSLVSSVAGWRGLPQALAYGPTKAALINLAQILYLDLRPAGIGVSVVNPGFVETPLTAGNEFAMPALLSPEQAAAHMLRGWEQGRFELHFPRRFTLWLRLLRLLPDRLYFRAVRRFTGL
ncbi:MAG: SDR family NAD(P)-dependent oxidoreductase [Betaproteobacteria bacterium]|jgi:NAD(P)-dependent dehydrogenase (short-subunit alcohol dehydrogenase family)|nr:SDR family NAD(P)-dependent oxidoreductase [Betaproteobacteria bacterium]MDE1954568.1 SDR family NAD(P)-dependent oxidoreductase [Betaproteobacteria bacterium]MDE2151609.1 SDR family NAD(P)-dependent oxidoreductase [Betaproteobacteria bacterium]MDE2477929.1 SDR family NAD(P)-dependent oxidoreductase [Betaproteobacteria bacterium]